MEQTIKKKNIWRRASRIAIKTVLWIFLLLVVLFLLLLTPPVQNFVCGRATNYLEKKLDTKVSIKRLFITLSGKIAVDGFYIEDRGKDTLLSAGKLRVDMSFVKLLFGKKELDIKSVLLEDATAKINRQLPDTTFNFQFIVDAFGSGSQDRDTAEISDSSASMPIHIGSVELNRLRFVYKDIVGGNDVEAGLTHLDTKIEKFDIDKLHFIVPQTNINGLTAKVIQTTPLIIIPQVVVKEVKEETTASSAPSLQMEFGKLDLQKSAVEYRDSVNAMYATLDLGALNVRPKKIDLATLNLDLGDIALNETSATVRLGQITRHTIKAETARSTKDTLATADGSIRLHSSSLVLNKVTVQFDDDNKPRQKKGMDYFHLKADIPVLDMKEFLYADDSIQGNMVKANLTEQSGFKLEELRTEFLYANNQSYLKKLYLKTPGSELKRDVAIRYASVDAMANDLANLYIDADIVDSKLRVKDILTFVPSLATQPAFEDANATWFLDGKITGRVGDMKIDRLKVSGYGNTKVDVAGRITGLPDPNKLNANLDIRQLSTTRKDILAFVPKDVIPSNITLPNTMSLTGRFNGGMVKMNTDLLLKTDIGSASIKGTTQNISDPKKAVYDLEIRANALDLGAILQDDSTYGPVSLTLKARGNGYDLNTSNADIHGIIHSAVYRQYEYKGLLVNATIAEHLLTADASMEDPNLDFTLNATADLSQEYPSDVKLDLLIDSVKAKELHLVNDELTYHGKIKADFASANPDSLIGSLWVTESVLVQQGQRIQMDTLELLSGRNADTSYLQLTSGVAEAQLRGKYKLTQLPNVFMKVIDPYYNISGAAGDTVTVEPYDFTIQARVYDRPTLRTLVPGLEKVNNVQLQSAFSSQEGVHAALTADEVIMSGTRLKGINVTANTEDSVLLLKAVAEQIASGSSIQLDSTILDARLANNIVDFDMAIKDKAQKDKYTIGGKLEQTSNNDLNFFLKPDNLTLKYDKWVVAKDNEITIASNGAIHANNFSISRVGQELSINSQSADVNAPIDVKLNNLRLGTFTEMFMSDSTLLDGLLNGQIVLKDLTTAPAFTGDLTASNFSFHRDTIGNIAIKVNSSEPNIYAAKVTLDGRGNDVLLDGRYDAKASSMDADLNIQQLPMKTIETFSSGMVRNTSGSVNGKFKISGTVSEPKVDGDLNFKKAALNVSMLNSYFVIDEEKLKVTEKGFEFDKFSIKDSSGNALTIDGTAATSNFVNYVFDMDVRANNFKALNSTKKDNKLFYGQLYFNANLKIKGTEVAPKVDGRLAINEKTKMTVVLPQNDPGVVDRQGIVEFVDMDNPVSDSLFVINYDSLNKSVFTGMDISVNIDVNKAADFTLIIDEGNGDFLHIKGAAQLNTGIDPSGKINMTGTYEVDQGTYELSFNTLKRKFDIQKGSTITWQGEPTDAMLDITAKYVAKAAPYDLVKGLINDEGEKNYYLQKLPFDVLLKMQGQLMKPQISFDIVLPENKNYGVKGGVLETTRTKLDQLRESPGDMNKQVFSLLLLNRFVADNPFASSGESYTEGYLRQSVSALLADQLNQLAEGLIQGVDINIGIESSDDYSSGEREARTEMNVGLSKKLMNDRLTVTVGSDITLEGPQTSNNQSMIGGNIAVDYALSADGRYKLRAYCVNDYQGVIDGYVVETGVGFIITVDYNKFKQMFMSKKKLDEQRRKQRERQEQENKQNSKGD